MTSVADLPDSEASGEQMGIYSIADDGTADQYADQPYMTTKPRNNISVRNAVRFQHETASASDEIDAQLCADFLKWLNQEQTAENRIAASVALQRSRE